MKRPIHTTIEKDTYNYLVKDGLALNAAIENLVRFHKTNRFYDPPI